ncbi:MAG TPA: DUF167 domain-containing protein [Candidatus Omnitrophota bacterium]|nr:DUF167 domain-containing protein [Candidatus Omnitrophota bacterium]
MKRISVRVVPRASKSEVREIGPENFKVYVTAPPVDGKGNEAVIELLAEYFNTARSRVRVLRGERGRDKIIEIQ